GTADYDLFGDSCCDVFPASLQPRMLVVIGRESPFYVDQLEPEDYETYQTFFPRAAEALRKRGIAAHHMGLNYLASDFVDVLHLSVAGGEKLAQELVPEVRELAVKLGYIAQGDDR